MIRITLNNFAGALDHFDAACPTDADIAAALAHKLLTDWTMISHGDSITISDGEAE